MSVEKVHFNRLHLTGKEGQYISEVNMSDKLAGDGQFTKRCHQWLEKYSGSQKVLLTHSCTAALEMSALLLAIQKGDEVIMPSYTFASTANAFVLRGGVPVFVDIREDTLNINEDLIEAAITLRTKAIVVVHYAGVACEMDAIMVIAKRHGLKVVEDAAQGVLASYKGRPLGSIGDFGAYSFHETKNLISGEGGALLVNDSTYSLHAEIIREKGTDRTRFLRGETDRYTWQEIGSSFLPSELVAAFLYAQLEASAEITQDRLNSWNRYHELLTQLESTGCLRRPVVPDSCSHNAHMYYVLLASEVDRQATIAELKYNGIDAVIHYIPLHSSPAGQKFCRTHGSMRFTDSLSARLIRLPLWAGLKKEQQTKVVAVLARVLS